MVSSKGYIKENTDCDTKLDIFIDSNDIMTIYPLDGWTGQAQVTLQAVNFNGEHDSTVFNVLVVEADDEDSCSAGARDGKYWKDKKSYKEPEVHLKYDKN